MPSRWSRFLFIVLAFLPLPLLAQAPASQKLPPKLAAAVDPAVTAEMEKQQVVGLAVGIVLNGEIAYLKGYGYADQEKKEPVSSKTLFRWASCSKPVTAVAVMQLVEKGQLDLEADVRKYVPEFPDKGTPITVRQVLCHQGGIVHYTNGKVVRTQRDYPKPNPFEDVVLALDMFKESPLVNQPGEKYSYSTHGYILLSAVAERAGKKKFADQVHERIVKPLGMTTLQPDYQWKNIPGRAVGYRKQNDKIARSTDTDVSWKLGGGGFLSNIDDFAKFAQGLINRRLVSEKTEAVMWEPQKLANGSAASYGLGFGVEINPEGKLRISHGGSQEKTRTMMVVYPRQKNAVVVMTNSEWVNPEQYSTLVIRALGGN